MAPTAVLDPAARARLAEAIRDAERDTAGEIVACVVHACDEYGSAPWRLAAGLALLTGLAIAAWFPHPSEVPLLGVLAAQAIAVAVGHALGRIDDLRRLLVSEALMETRAATRALATFAGAGLTRTKARTGILVFVALFEHRVIVLGDEAIDQVLAPGESWEEVKDLALREIRAGRLEAGLLAAVRRCGEILRAHIPAAPHDLDELPNRVIVED